MALLDTLRRTVAAHDPPLIEAGDRVLVAVSGGPDSLALLHALTTLRVDLGIVELYAAHLDHGLRGAESRADAEFVVRFCTDRGIACAFESTDVAAEHADRRGSKQQIARDVRYQFLNAAASAFAVNKIATGHTRDDQVETVLLNIIRGTGIDGLCGIPARRDGIIRPLLGTMRAEVEAYCAEHGLTPRRDPSNESPEKYTRNRVRLELLPLLERDYAPGVRGALLRLSGIAEAERDYIRGEAERALAAATITSEPNLALDRVALTTIHPALLRSVLRLAIEARVGSLDGVSFEHIEQVVAAVHGQAPLPFSITTPTSPQCIVRVDPDCVSFARRVAAIAPPPTMEAVPLLVPGTVRMQELGLSITAELHEETSALPAHGDVAQVVVLDADRIDLAGLMVRTWHPGDRIDPLGMGGQTKKLQDIFTDAKIPAGERWRVPVVADTSGPVWVVGLIIAERAKVTRATTNLLRLSMVPQEQ
jgi:tRNA(Ile)-lysidine synthase